jgi:hypothetical protein
VDATLCVLMELGDHRAHRGHRGLPGLWVVRPIPLCPLCFARVDQGIRRFPPFSRRLLARQDKATGARGLLRYIMST